MSQAYPRRKLSELAARIDYGLTASATQDAVGPRFLRITDIVPEQVDWSTVPFCGPVSERDRARFALEVGDIVIARTGATVGYSKRLNVAVDAVFASYLVRVRVNPDCDATYIGYVVGSDDYKAFVRANAGGAAQPNANARVLTSYEVPLPPLAAQRRIGSILSAYDELIENNSRRIRLLDEMAQRTYREWFVDFRYTGHEGVSLVDSELGPVPEGWQLAPLSTVVQHHIGGGWGADEPSEAKPERARVIRGTDIPRLRQLDVSTCPIRHHSESNLKSRLLGSGDIVVEVSGGSKGQPVGRSLFVTSEMLDELGMPTICASFCKLVRCDRERLAPEILIHRLMDAYGSGELGEYQVQSTGITNLRFAQLLSGFAVTVPPKAVQAQFGQMIAPNISLAARLGRTVRNLRATRDLLLPRLVSGEIDVLNLNMAIPELAA